VAVQPPFYEEEREPPVPLSNKLVKMLAIPPASKPNSDFHRQYRHMNWSTSSAMIVKFLGLGRSGRTCCQMEQLKISTQKKQFAFRILSPKIGKHPYSDQQLIDWLASDIGHRLKQQGQYRN
jgi:hypothetical protein